MPRFYFPIIDGTRLEDPVGLDLPNTDLARRHAENIACHLANLGNDRHVVAVSEDGEEVHRVLVKRSRTEAT